MAVPPSTPIDNAWLLCEVDLDLCAGAMAEWLSENAEHYDRRALVLAAKSDLTMYRDGDLEDYAANGNVESRLGKRAQRGGPVLAFLPDLRLLDRAIRLADQQVLGVVEHAPGRMEGWAAATKALNLITGERHPGVPEEIGQALADLYQAGYNGYSRDRESFFAHKYFPPIDKLMAAGYTYEFVASYLVALGRHGESVGDALKRIYVPPEKRRKLKKRYGG
jgi:hypothetical protein